MSGENTFHVFYNQVYLPQVRNIDRKTIKSRVTLIEKYAFPRLGHMILNEIDPFTINNLIRSLSDKGLSPTTISLLFMEVRSVLKLAASMGIISSQHFPCFSKRMSHSCSCMYVPHAKFVPHWYTLSEMKIIEEALTQIPLAPLFRLAMYTGLKTCEILALRISDYNQANQTLSIERILHRFTRSQKNYAFIPLAESSPKRRIILLSQPARQAIQEASTQSMQIHEKLSCSEPESMFLFSRSDGSPVSETEVFRSAKTIQRMTSLERFNLSALRDNFIVLCFRNHWAEAQIQDYVGIAMPQNILPHKKIALSTSVTFQTMS